MTVAAAASGEAASSLIEELRRGHQRLVAALAGGGPRRQCGLEIDVGVASAAVLDDNGALDVGSGFVQSRET